MKSISIFLLLFASLCATAQNAASYLAKILKYNEKSIFEDMRYKAMDWKAFEKLEEANDLVDPVNYDFDLMNAAVFFAVNKYRSVKGLQPLLFEPRLRDAASIHCDQMVKRKFFDHINSFDSRVSAPDNRVELCDYHGQMIAENLARSFVLIDHPLTYVQIAEKAVAELSRSREHNKHMTDPELKKLGCGVLFEDKPLNGYHYFRLTQDFGTDW